MKDGVYCCKCEGKMKLITQAYLRKVLPKRVRAADGSLVDQEKFLPADVYYCIPCDLAREVTTP